jgi:serine/threonine protein kinase
MLQIVEGLIYLKEQKVNHRDLKPKNILVRLTGINQILFFCIDDFGISKVFTTNIPNQAYTKNAGTIGYMFPEVTNSGNSKRYDFFAADGKLYYWCIIL